MPQVHVASSALTVVSGSACAGALVYRFEYGQLKMFYILEQIHPATQFEQSSKKQSSNVKTSHQLSGQQ
ncbi:unnamed protein product [Fusarium graminearum]|uniref:Chromosome 2, complete genome n=1 Tax=Gibberella zeae (strain ATCC MYA-4620 / CBS 123657 / FGSC 9075 / NRRL 31084 / PH-1) TaxID=229533 RepID=A0A098DGB0_GIBZE|nr:unnamed protein product [Fusarium graminearum]